jgi:hypothetical protein
MGIVTPDGQVVIKAEEDELEEIMPAIHLLGCIRKSNEFGPCDMGISSAAVNLWMPKVWTRMR